ncbi:hypothetical protein [Devosia sp.]|uniref:hypothetical protein n=1 Tax=Devosia sp. TaxID=1871048 RepID=UPI003267354C
MAIVFRRHDTIAQNLSSADRSSYARLKAALIARQTSQAEADSQLDAFFWKCFEDDAEDEGDDQEP